MLNEDGECPTCCAINSVTTKEKTKKRRVNKNLIVVIIAAMLMLIVAAIAVLYPNSETGSVESLQKCVSKLVKNGTLSKKEYKSLIENGGVDITIGGDGLVETLCDIVKKYEVPIEENRVSKEYAKEIVDSIAGQYGLIEWRAESYWNIYMYKHNEKDVFVECDTENSARARRFYIFDVHNDVLYMIIDGEKGFRYIEYRISLNSDLAEKKEKIPRYSSAFVDKATQIIICGYEWYVIDEECYVHAVYGEGGKAEIYAIRLSQSDKDDIYLDSSYNISNYEYYSSVTSEHSDYVSETYLFYFGHWGI